MVLEELCRADELDGITELLLGTVPEEDGLLPVSTLLDDNASPLELETPLLLDGSVPSSPDEQEKVRNKASTMPNASNVGFVFNTEDSCKEGLFTINLYLFSPFVKGMS
jgi:hypothetical protein